MENFGKFCFGILVIIITTLLGGYAFMKLWDWFIMYAFKVQHINLIQSIGIVFFLGYIMSRKTDDEKMTWEKLIKLFIDKLLWFGVILGIGWIITLFQ